MLYLSLYFIYLVLKIVFLNIRHKDFFGYTIQICTCVVTFSNIVSVQGTRYKNEGE